MSSNRYGHAVPRWEHGSEERLQEAALELFEEQGFESTSVGEIAERARVTTRTFFRYFPDKRDVLFARADHLRDALVDRMLRAPDVEEPLQAVVGVLAGFDWDGQGRESQRRRQAVIAANPELLERDLIKHEDIAVAFADVLRRRGVDPEIAGLASRVGAQVFRVAYDQWSRSVGEADITAIARDVLALLGSLTPTGQRVVEPST
jgi:AcrR family transcriptional regulator